MTPEALPRLLDVEDVAHWLGWTRAAVQRMARQGCIPARTLPDGRLAFDAAELVEWFRALPCSGSAADDS